MASFQRQTLRLLCLCRLHRPTDLILLLQIGLWGSLLATAGKPQWGAVLLLLLASTLIRCAAWVLNDWADARISADARESFIAQGLVTRRQAQWLLATLLLMALLLILPLPTDLLYFAMLTPLLLLGLPLIRTRLALSQVWLGLCIAWLIPLTYAAQGLLPDKAGWLLFTAVLLWASAFTTLYALPRRQYEGTLGIRSLAQVFGDQSGMFVLFIQTTAIFTLWLVGLHLELGIFYTLGLVVALLLLPWQLWLLFSSSYGASRSYYSQIWTGLAISCGIIFHFLCQNQVLN